ncbi:MAG: N-acetylmuramoyl-L-alanine amidase [Anaerolineae bacterium]|nr:N-acetylmuramoyl-L-alanine amidase [Anaerolineae bacterium]MCO5206326.1 N-acetylmuramoyl-L-alanine amidase [Anaerolineae bacterium]
MASSSYRDTDQEGSRSERIVFGQPLLAIAFIAVAAFGMLMAYFFFGRMTQTPVNSYAVVALAEPDTNILELGSAGFRERWIASDGEPFHVGIISGHQGSDAGAVCDNGLTEADVNRNIANKVAERLQEDSIVVDILDEFDPRLDNYAADVLVSIHADSCRDYGDSLTGFKLAAPDTRASLGLKNCMYQAYATTTQLFYHVNTITEHMTDYHVFRKIAPDTPAVIIETGFMNRDMALLTDQSDVPAEGIEIGILCYLEQQQ